MAQHKPVTLVYSGKAVKALSEWLGQGNCPNIVEHKVVKGEVHIALSPDVIWEGANVGRGVRFTVKEDAVCLSVYLAGCAVSGFDGVKADSRKDPGAEVRNACRGAIDKRIRALSGKRVGGPGGNTPLSKYALTRLFRTESIPGGNSSNITLDEF